MTDSPLSRRHFFGATAAVAIGTQFHAPASATESKPSPFAPEPLLPPGVCQRLGSARFRELTSGFRFSPDSKWLAQFSDGQYIGYEVATGRRVKWAVQISVKEFYPGWGMTSIGVLLVSASVDGGDQSVLHFRIESGELRKGVKLPADTHQAFTPNGAALIQYGGATGQLWRTDLASGKQVWERRWDCDASVPPVVLSVTKRWIVAVGMKRLHLFNPATGKDGPRLEEALPADAPPDNHFQLLNFSADGKRVCGWFTADVPGRAVVWDLETGKVVGRLSPQTDAARSALSADGRLLFTTLADEQGRLAGIDVRTGRVTRKLAARNVGAFELSPDGKVMAALYFPSFSGPGGLDGIGNEPGGIVRLLNADTGELLPQSPDPSAELKGVRFVNAHTLAAETITGGPVLSHLVWDIDTNRRRVISCSIPPFQFAGLGGAFLNELSPDATRYISLVNTGMLGASEAWVTDAVTRRRLYKLSGDFNGYPDVPFWIGRGKVGVVGRDSLTVYDLVDHVGRTVPLTLSADWRTTPVATPDGSTVVISHPEDDKGQPNPRVTWLDIKTGRTSTCHGAEGEPTVSPDGDHVAITDTGVKQPDGQVRITVLNRAGRRGSFVVLTSSPLFEISPGLLSPCGRTVFVAHEKPGEVEAADPIPVVQFWEVLSGELRAEFITAYKAGGLGLSPCGRRLATTHRDAPIYLWDVFGEQSDPQPKPDKAIWDALNGPTDKAFTAIRRLVQHPATAVELLAVKLAPAEAPKPEWVKARINNLGNPDFRTRHKAELELSAVADVIAEPLRAAFDAGADTQEAHERLERLVQRATGIPPAAICAVRAVEVLEYCDVPSAGVLLKKLATGVESAVLTREAKAAVKRRGERPA